MSSHSLHDPRDLAARRADLDAADVFLTSLAQGKDDSAGQDPLAAMLLDLKSEVDAPLPPVPDVTEHVLSVTPASGSAHPGAQCAVPRIHGRHERRRRGNRSPWMMSVVGASVGALAASALIVVGGSVVYNAEPGDTLWGTRVAVFGEPEANLVQLASAFEQVDNLANEGDVEGARQVIEEARQLIKYLDERERRIAERRLDVAQRSIETPTTTTSVSSTTVTETETVVVTQTQTETVPPSEPTPADGAQDPTNSQSPAPNAPTATPTTTVSDQPEPAPAQRRDLVDSVRRLTGNM